MGGYEMNRDIGKIYKESKLLDKIVIRIYDTFEGYSLLDVLSMAIPCVFIGILFLVLIIAMVVEFPALIMIPLPIMGIAYLIKLTDKRAKSLLGKGFLS